jgi:hypothetical protein
MKTLLFKITFGLLIITLLSGCRTQSFSYTKNKIQRNFSNYEILLNSVKIDIDTIYLDKDNIKSIKISKKENTINITQKKNNVEYFSPQNAFQGEFESVIIDGKLAEELKIKRIEVGATKSLEILADEKARLFNHKIRGKGFLIITLK